MNIINQKRDKAWLKKKAVLSPPGYYLEVQDEIAGTVAREMEELFADMVPGDQAQSSVIFRRIEDPGLGEEGYIINRCPDCYEIQGNTTRALLYGMYALHRILIDGETVRFPFCSVPAQRIRMLDHWDNFDGSIERGYAGDSIFYSANRFRNDFALIREYARLLASTGINTLAVNNVNVHEKEAFLVMERCLREIKPIADILAEYGIKLFLSVNYAAPIIVGGLATADPQDPAAGNWWRKTVETIYRIIPQFGGFLVKADSEGEPGPFTYGRNHDDGANMLARAIAPFDGIVIWRCFVYNCHQDWRNRSNDRAKAQYETYIGLDGKFDDNVILQIKNGPMDFQVREPVSPLFGALKHTNQILEYQITQEYTGQQKHIFYLLPMWKTVLNYDTKYQPGPAAVCDLLRENSPVKAHSGIAAVANVGMDSNWTGHKLAQANLYGFGRMAWDNQLSSEQILDEWMALTFDLTPNGKKILKDIMMTSADTYESYSAPNGIGFMVKPVHHYGPDVDGYEYDRWGTYHYADRDGIGAERTLSDGTGYTRQYSDRRFEEYESLESCPDELLLFFHHVPYTHLLHSGKTLIQSIYDTHFAGVERVSRYMQEWEALKAELDPDSYANVKQRLEEQYESAKEWRDQINTYFYRKSGIPDEKGRTIYR